MNSLFGFNQVYLDEDYNYKGISVKAQIIVPYLNGIHNSGVGNVALFEVNDSDDFYIDNTGTGTISISGSAESLMIKNEGSGNIEGTGKIINSN